MAEAKLRQEIEATANCCNGRVGHRLLELVEQRKELQRFVVPTGVELVKAAIDAGLTTGHTVNCCNGRVGKLPMEELITTLGGS